MIDKNPNILDHTRVSSMLGKERNPFNMNRLPANIIKSKFNNRRVNSSFGLLAALPLLLPILFSFQNASASDGISAAPPGADKNLRRAPKLLPETQELQEGLLRQAKLEVQNKAGDAQARFKLGEAYRKLGQTEAALAEYHKATQLDPSLWVAYHQLCQLSSDEKMLDEAILKLSKLESEKPRELLLRVALSELYEKRGNYYQAARTLIDITYANAVPEKYKTKVNARIHNLLVLSKTANPGQPQAQPHAQTANMDEDLDLMPAPLPTPSSKRSLAQAKLKDSKEVRGVGHTNLLP